MNTPLLSLKKISLKIPQLSEPILSHINYDIYPNDFILILGANGSGKSSLLKLIYRQYLPTDGQIDFNNEPIKKIPLRYFHQSVGLLTQNYHESLFTELTVLENYLLFSQKKNTEKNRNDFSQHLSEFNPKLMTKLSQTVDALSGGEKQALALALRFIYPPQILLLDEHTSALDPKTANRIMELTHQMIKKYQITCLFTTHNLQFAEIYGNRILALNQGKIHKMIDRNRCQPISSKALLAVCF